MRYGDTAIRRYGDTAIRRYGDIGSKLANVKLKKKKSFTLVEVVFTISIIGILMAILLPAVSAVKLSAQKVRDISNLQKIAEPWRECAINRGWKTDGKASKGWHWCIVFAEQLAGLGQVGMANILLNTSSVYISPGDKYASKILNEPLCGSKNGVVVATSNCYNFISNFMITNEVLISYCLIMNLPANVPLDTTPFAFTRGLHEDGKWDEKAGLYGSKGGYVVYCDGHTVWFDASRPAKFLHWNQKEYTTDIRKTVPNSAFISCCNGNGNANYKSDESLVILYHFGTGGN
jgi:hypothetical protein